MSDEKRYLHLEFDGRVGVCYIKKGEKKKNIMTLSVMESTGRYDFLDVYDPSLKDVSSKQFLEKQKAESDKRFFYGYIEVLVDGTGYGDRPATQKKTCYATHGEDREHVVERVLWHFRKKANQYVLENGLEGLVDEFVEEVIEDEVMSENI